MHGGLSPEFVVTENVLFVNQCFKLEHSGYKIFNCNKQELVLTAVE